MIQNLNTSYHLIDKRDARKTLIVRIIAIVAVAHIIILGVSVICTSCNRSDTDTATSRSSVTNAVSEIPVLTPVRQFPMSFPKRTTMPDMRECEACDPISNSLFSAGRDLVFVEDSRVWWESDEDGEDDDECDHSMHKSMALPFKRLVELVVASNATLKVQETYRASGIHSTKSLHKEGRAIDVTCPDLGLEVLAKMCWAAGFDWVYYEVPRNTGNGPHIHASVRR